MNIHTPILGTVFLFIFVYLSLSSVAIPPLPMQFFGKANANATTPVLQGDTVVIKDSSNVTCGSYQVIIPSVYGLLSCQGDDSQTAFDEGPISGEEVSFFINNELVTNFNGNNVWTEGISSRVDLAAKTKKSKCGDGVCSSGESCTTCSADCGACPIPEGSTSTAESSESSDQESDESGDVSSESSSGGGSSGGGSGRAYFRCVEAWDCSEWTECAIDEVRSRVCRDVNSCGSQRNKPSETDFCSYLPTCIDGVQNGNESGIDCGGSCDACPSCFDGIQNQYESGVDCGGPCDACPIPPPTPPPVFVDPGPVCGDNLCEAEESFSCKSDCREFPKTFLFLSFTTLISVLLLVRFETIYKMSHKKYKHILISMRLRKFYTYALAAIVFIFLLAYYQFHYCVNPVDCRNNLWLLFITFAGLGGIAYYFNNSLNYNANRRSAKEIQMLSTYQKHLLTTLQIQSKQILDLASQINSIARNNSELEPILAQNTELKIALVSLANVKLPENLTSKVEENLSEIIKKIVSNSTIAKDLNNHHSLKSLLKLFELVSKLTADNRDLRTELNEVKQRLLDLGYISKKVKPNTKN